MKKINTFNQNIKLINSNKVFEPNLTTQALIEACNKLKFNKKKKNFRSGLWLRNNWYFFKKKNLKRR